MRRPRRSGFWALASLLVSVAALLTGCTGGSGSSGTLTIFATPAMTEAIGGMTSAYHAAYPGVEFQTVFEPDSALAQRVAAGSTPDLLVAEDPATLTAAGVTGDPVHVARGQLVVAVPTSNPARVVQLADLGRPGVRVALCDNDEPCGRVAEAVLAAAQVTLADTALREPDVRSALRHVTDGTADAALVYRSDAAAEQDGVLTIEVPASSVALADFVAIVPERAPHHELASAFLAYLSSAPVLDTLTANGFRPRA